MILQAVQRLGTDLDGRAAGRCIVDRMSGSGGLYFEVAAVVTTFLLLGRFLEANAKAKAGDALKALLNLGVIATIEGRAADARAIYNRSRALFVSTGDGRGEAMAMP